MSYTLDNVSVQDVKNYLEVMDPHLEINNHQIELVLMALRTLRA